MFFPLWRESRYISNPLKSQLYLLHVKIFICSDSSNLQSHHWNLCAVIRGWYIALCLCLSPLCDLGKLAPCQIKQILFYTKYASALRSVSKNPLTWFYNNAWDWIIRLYHLNWCSTGCLCAAKHSLLYLIWSLSDVFSKYLKTHKPAFSWLF